MSNVTNPLESVEAELAKLQAPDDKEAQRRAKIAELKAQKNQLLSAAAEVEKQALIAELKVDFDRSLAAWKKFQDDFEAELVALFSNYCHIRQHAVIAKNLPAQRTAENARQIEHAQALQRTCAHAGNFLVHAMSPSVRSVNQASRRTS